MCAGVVWVCQCGCPGGGIAGLERLDVLEGLLGRAPDMGKDGVDDTLGAWAVHELRTVCPEEPHPANFVRIMLTRE